MDTPDNLILLAHEGVSTRQIARRLHTRPARVSKWRQRFAWKRLEGLSDAPRSGKPKTYDQATEKRILSLLDTNPPSGYSQWNGRLLAQALKDVSDDQVWRILRQHKIQLQRRQSWGISTVSILSRQALRNLSCNGARQWREVARGD